MATLQSSPLPCTISPLSTREPCRFHSLKTRSSKLRATSFSVHSPSELRDPEPKLTHFTHNTRHYPRTEASSAQTSPEIIRVSSLLNNDSVCDFRQIHAFALKSNAFVVDSSIGNKLVTLYSRNMESLGNARNLFDEIPTRTRPGFAALITAYCRSERWGEMFSLLGLMAKEGLFPDRYVLPTVLKACASLKLTRNGKTIHGHALRNGLVSDVFVGNSLIDFYSNCGFLISSRIVFDSMSGRDVVSWTSLVSAYMNSGFTNEATKVFLAMQGKGLKPNLISWNALVSGYARNGEIDSALRSLERMQEKGLKPRVSSWNGIISGCVHNKYFEYALDVFDRMLRFPEDPNFVTIASILPACTGLGDLSLGKKFHGFSLRHRLWDNVHVEGSLIDMYSKCGKNDYAKRVFDKAKRKNTAMWNEMIRVFVDEGKIDKASELLCSMRSCGPKPDVISFNTMIACHARKGEKDLAYRLFSEMIDANLKPNIVSYNVLISGFQQSGLTYEALRSFRAMLSPSQWTEAVRPNTITTASALAACAQLNLKLRGMEIHGYSLRNGFERNSYVSSALVHMYSKSGDVDSAAKVFRRITDKNAICWNALIAGHINNAQPELAIEVFSEMVSEAVEPSSITIMVLLLACGDLAALRSGREIHAYVLKRCFDKYDENLTNALVGMYAKCGSIAEAKSVFDSKVKDVDLWNSTILACSVYGVSKSAVTLFEQLELAGILPRNCR